MLPPCVLDFDLLAGSIMKAKTCPLPTYDRKVLAKGRARHASTKVWPLYAASKSVLRIVQRIELDKNNFQF